MPFVSARRHRLHRARLPTEEVFHPPKNLDASLFDELSKLVVGKQGTVLDKAARRSRR